MFNETYINKLIIEAVYYLSFSLFAQAVKIKIIQTIDEHGTIFPYDFTDQKEINTSLAQVYSYIRQKREKKDQKVILLSGGDVIQGTPAVYYYNFEKTDSPHLYANVMDYMKYAAGTLISVSKLNKALRRKHRGNLSIIEQAQPNV